MKLENLRKLRKEKGLTQEKFAKLLNVSTTTYINWEQGDFQPSIEILIKLADYFNTTIDFLVGREETGFTPEEKDILRIAASIIDKKIGKNDEKTGNN